MLAGIEIPFLPRIAVVCFIGALIHSFCTHRFLAKAKQLAQGPEKGSTQHVLMELFGHLTFVFALWLTPVFLLIGLRGGSDVMVATLSGADLTEPFANFAFMFLAFSPTFRAFFSRLVSKVSQTFGGSELSWWASCLLLGVAIDGILSEAATIILVASAMREHVFARSDSHRLCYGTFALLASVLAIGSLVLPFNLTASLDLSSAWGWTHWTIVETLSWRALFVVILLITLGALFLKDDIGSLASKPRPEIESGPLITPAVLAYFLAFIICGFLEHVPVALITVVAFVCVIESAAKHPQHDRRLLLPLLIALFNYSMELHAFFLSDTVKSLYQWVGAEWQPLLTACLSGLNEHIPGTHFIQAFIGQDTVLQGRGLLALTFGGGLLLFSTSMNVVAYKLLRDSFPNGIISLWRFLVYSLPVGGIAFLLFRLTYWILP